jgi:hypothetical protein
MDTLKIIDLRTTVALISYASLINLLENSDFKDELTNTAKEVIKQMIGDDLIGVEASKVIEIIEKCFGYRMVGYRTGGSFMFLKNE